MNRAVKRLPPLPVAGLLVLLLVLAIPAAASAQYAGVSPTTVYQGIDVTAYWGGFSGSVHVRLYNGTTYHYTLAYNRPSSGSLPFSTSGLAPDTDWRVRVDQASNPSIYRWSGYFRVNTPPDVSVSPDHVVKGTDVEATWSGFTGNVNVYLYNGTSNYALLASNQPSSGSWTVDTSGLSVDSDWRIRVQLSSNSSLYWYSEDFSVSDPAVSTTPGDVLAGTDVLAEWSGFGGNVDVYLYRGTSYDRTLATNRSGTGSWTVDTSGLSARADWRILVRLASFGSVFDVSDDFIVRNPYVSRSSSEVLAGANVTVSWSGFVTGTVDVYLYNGVDQDSLLASDRPYNGSWQLDTAGLTADTDWRFRVEVSTNPTLYEYSEDFAVNVPSVTVNPPHVLQGQTVTAQWTGFVGNVNVYLYNGTVYERQLESNRPGSGSYPVNPSYLSVDSDWRIRVQRTTSSSIYGLSGDFSVSDPVVSATPSQVPVGSDVLAEWSGFGGDVNVVVMIGGGLWSVELTDQPGTSSAALNTTGWVLRPDYRVRVELAAYPSIASYSGYFEVVEATPLELADLELANLTLGSGGWVKDEDTIGITVTVTGLGTYEPGDVTADLSGLGGLALAPPDDLVDDVASWTESGVACVPADGQLVIEVTATNDAAVSVSLADSLVADNTVPGSLAGLAAAPGHRSVALVWDDPSSLDAHFDRVVVRCIKWDAYPAYATAPPDYPADPAAGLPVYDGVDTGVDHVFAGDERGVYRYTAFVLDHAGNASAVSAGAGLASATNYRLGDVGSGALGPYDGLVTVADHTGLASAYGLDDLDPLFKPECDVGPTDDYSPTGRPVPDGLVGFEDLVVFAMNYEAGAKLQSPAGTGVPVLAWERVEDRVWALRLVEPCANLKALHVTADLPAGVAPEVSAGDLIAAQTAPVFLRNIDRLGLDAGLAIMGRGVGLVDSGELLRVRLAAGASLTSAVIQARGIDNAVFDLEPTIPVGPPVPAVFRMAQNFPNPFNPRTRISFGLPEPQQVRLSVYTLRGRRVATLLDEPLPAGVHEVVWQGRDETGRELASGTYIYRIVAGPHTETRKMILMK